MRRHLRNPWVWVAAALLFAVWLFWPRTVNSPAPGETPPAASTPASAPAARRDAATPEELAAIPADLPPDVRETAALILRGGPFPYREDGSVFGNREAHLPPRPRGYYREYTVDTPGLSHRGARRIVTGGQPPEVWFYTEDHYASFKVFRVNPQATSAPPGGGSAR
jgi:guanyl-specific ribonuclease Sa